GSSHVWMWRDRRSVRLAYSPTHARSWMPLHPIPQRGRASTSDRRRRAQYDELKLGLYERRLCRRNRSWGRHRRGPSRPPPSSSARDGAGAAGEDGLEAEVGERVLQVGEEPLDRAHRRVRHVLEREAHPLLVLSERRDRVPELVAVEGHQRARVGGELELDERAAARVVLEELANQPARRALDEAH